MERLFEIGPAVSTGNGPRPLKWSDLLEWMQFSGARPRYWEARLLRRLSFEYLDEQQDTDPNRPMPWDVWLRGDENRERVDRQLNQLFDALMKQRGENQKDQVGRA